MAKSLAKTFKATLERDGTSLGWTIVRVPRTVTEGWQARNRFRVKGEVSREASKGFAFRTSLFPTGNGDFTLLVNKRMQAGAGVTLGSVATFRLEPDTEEREVAIPAELKQALTGEPSLRRWYDRLPYAIRKYVTDIVTQPKSAEARVRRAETMAEHLLAMQEGERETPPILEAAFVRAPLARRGWELMTPAQRRGHLWGIFYYRSPEARQRRTDKAVEDAIRVAKAKD
ncbi:MAG TPA: YdeI/OmpD-associated family protein [Silvibacterium sp.]|nr:YdeI/OmpD-associated family protein [Silvibacterium sp.]